MKSLKKHTLNSQKTKTSVSNSVDENAIRAIHQRMIEAWNAGDGSAFAARFSGDSDFVVWDGTHLKGREDLASFTQRVFDTVMKGSRLKGEVKFVRFLGPDLALMHSVVRVTLPGQTNASPGRDSMELTVVTKRDGEWHCEGLMNARKLTMERQLLLDDLDSLRAEAERQVMDLITSLKKRHLRK